MKLTKIVTFFSLIVYSHSSLYNVPLRILNQTALKYVKNSDLDADCAADLSNLLSDVFETKMWAFKMLDASGKIYPGFFNGNFHLFGDYDECLDIEQAVTERNIKGQYCTLRVSTHYKPLGFTKSVIKSKELEEYLSKLEFREVSTEKEHSVLLWGVCVPKSCSLESVQNFARHFMDTLGVSGDVSVEEDLCFYQGKPLKTTHLENFSYYFFVVTISLTIASTTYDAYLRLTGQTPNVFVVFSAYTNFERLLSQRPNNHNTLTCLNGIKVISSTWVVLGHTVLFYRFIAKNVHYIYDEWNHQAFHTFMWSGHYSFDTFLTISGFLTSYIYLKHTEVFSVDLVTFYLIRYIRLTPALVAAVLVHTTMLKFLANGPYGLFIANYVANHCGTTWWSPFFFVLKIMDFKRCALHLGYLAIDNQLYIFAPLILFNIKKSTTKVMKGMVFAFIISVTYSVIVTQTKGVGFTVFEWSDDFQNYLYFSTLHRMPCWLLGLIFGYLFYYKKFKPSRKLNLLLWVISLGVMLKLVTGQTVFISTEYSLHRSVLWNALARPLWSLCICFIIYSCGVGNGGVVNTFLSHAVFRVLSKLTYSVYLVHFTVLLYYFGNQKEALQFGTIEILFKFIGLFVLVLATSVILYLGFEAPIVSLKDQQEEKSATKNI